MKAFFVAGLMAMSAMPALAMDMTQNPADVKAGTYTLNPDHGKITWSVNHLGYSTYIGQFDGASGTLVLDPKAISKTTLNVTLAIDSVGTMSAKLDGELKSPEFFNQPKYPTATFVSTKIVKTGLKTAKIYGDLTLMGVTKPEVLNATFNLAGTNPIIKMYQVGFDGTMMLKRSEFGLKTFIPYIGDEVSLQIEGEFILKS